MKAPDFLEGNEAVLKVIPTGSRYICDPPVMDTDEDWAVLIDHFLRHEFIKSAEDAGFYRTNIEYTNWSEAGELITFRNPDSPVNLIVHTDEDFFNAFAEATLIAKEENLLDKADRIELFEKMRRAVHRRKANRSKYEDALPFDSDYFTQNETPVVNDYWFDAATGRFIDALPAGDN